MDEYIDLVSVTYQQWETKVVVCNDKDEEFRVTFIGGCGKTQMIVTEISTPHFIIEVKPDKTEPVGCIAVPQDVEHLTAKELLTWVYDFLGDFEFFGYLKDEL